MTEENNAAPGETPGRRCSLSKNHLNGYARQVVFSIYEQKSSRIVQKTEVFHLHFASFFRFMAAYFSLTQFVTRARPRWWV